MAAPLAAQWPSTAWAHLSPSGFCHCGFRLRILVSLLLPVALCHLVSLLLPVAYWWPCPHWRPRPLLVALPPLVGDPGARQARSNERDDTQKRRRGGGRRGSQRAHPKRRGNGAGWSGVRVFR